MKLLQIISSTNPDRGGPIEAVTQFGRELAKSGHESEVLCSDAPDAPWLEGTPLKVYALGPKKYGSFACAPRMVGWLRENAANYDAVIVNGLWQFHSLAAWRTLRGKSIPYIVYPHGMLDPWFKQAFPAKYAKKLVYWLLAEYRILRDAAAVCFTCEEERRLARTTFQPYKVNEAVVNFGTAKPEGDAVAQKDAFSAAFPQLAGKRVILFLGRLHVKKGCDLLLRAFASVAGGDQNLHLVMAGPDQSGWRKDLERNAEALGVAERITWTGMLTGDLKWGAFRSAEVFALPSHQENFGIAVAEALACGIPVLITDKVNIWREVIDAGAGIVSSDNQEGVTGLLDHWLDLGVADKQAMSENAVRCFAEHFEIERATESMLDVIRSVSQAI